MDEMLLEQAECSNDDEPKSGADQEEPLEQAGCSNDEEQKSEGDYEEALESLVQSIMEHVLTKVVINVDSSDGGQDSL
jgi:hypothetical protein